MTNNDDDLFLLLFLSYSEPDVIHCTGDTNLQYAAEKVRRWCTCLCANALCAVLCVCVGGGALEKAHFVPQRQDSMCAHTLTPGHQLSSDYTKDSLYTILFLY